MAASIFEDRGVVPDDRMVESTLADTYVIWNELRNHVNNDYSSVNEEWKNYGKSSGWVLLTKVKKRTLFYMIPKDGYFVLNFVLGEKAIAEAENAPLPEDVIENLRSAKQYMEGRPVFVDVRSSHQIESLKMLTSIKYRN